MSSDFQNFLNENPNVLTVSVSEQYGEQLQSANIQWETDSFELGSIADPSRPVKGEFRQNLPRRDGILAQN